jgi:acetylornithine/succinyldiaminopimelate/putrescine aminotransferase
VSWQAGRSCSPSSQESTDQLTEGTSIPSSHNKCLISRNPLGCAVAITALEVLEREDLANRSQRLGEIFRQGLRELNSPFIKIIRGRGLFNGVVIDESVSTKKRTAWQLCLLMKSKGWVFLPQIRMKGTMANEKTIG